MESWKILSCKGPYTKHSYSSIQNTRLYNLEHCLDAPLIMTGLVLFWANSNDQTPTQWRTFSQCLARTFPGTVLFHEGIRGSALPSLPPLTKLWADSHPAAVRYSGLVGDGVHIQKRRCAAATAYCDKQIYLGISCLAWLQGGIQGFLSSWPCPLA